MWGKGSEEGSDPRLQSSSHVTLREKLDGQSHDDVFLLLAARIKASVGAVGMSKRVIGFMLKRQVGNAESVAEVTLELHSQLNGTATLGELAEGLSVAVEEVNEGFADGVVGVAFEAICFKEADAATHETLEVGEVGISLL